MWQSMLFVLVVVNLMTLNDHDRHGLVACVVVTLPLIQSLCFDQHELNPVAAGDDRTAGGGESTVSRKYP